MIITKTMHFNFPKISELWRSIACYKRLNVQDVHKYGTNVIFGRIKSFRLLVRFISDIDNE